MTGFIITSSVLIAAVLALRAIFRGRVSSRVIYALWALVLLRLIAPVNILQSPVSVMSSPITEAVSERAEEIAGSDVLALTRGTPTAYASDGALPGTDAHAAPAVKTVTLRSALTAVWIAGSAAAAAWLIWRNARFYSALRRTRRPFGTSGRLKVYVADGLPSPCLAGFFRPAVYLTPEAAADARSLPFVTAHEETHYSHLDHIWALFRGLCIVAYWWHPLVWAAALLSREDCEAACDERVVERLGEEKRVEYGRALVAAVGSGRSSRFVAATTMTAGGRSVRRRVELIVKKKKTLCLALIIVLLAAAAAAGCTLTGGKAESAPPEASASPEASAPPSASAAPEQAGKTELESAARFDAAVTGTMEEAGQSWAVAVCRNHVELPNDNPLSCAEATVISCKLVGESVLSSPKYAVYEIELAFKPRSQASFLEDQGAGVRVGVSGGVAQQWEVRLICEDGETWKTNSVGFDGARVWGIVDYELDAAAALGAINTLSPEDCYALLPVINFAELSKPEADLWNTLWLKLDEGAIGSARDYGEGKTYADEFPDDQKYRAAYLLYGLSRTDGAYTEGLMDIAKKMIEAAPDDFYFALEQLPAETRARVELIGLDWYDTESWYA